MKQKLAVTAQTFGALASILGENSAAGKAAAIAQATINTYQGVTEVLANKSTLPQPFATIEKIASIATVPQLDSKQFERSTRHRNQTSQDLKAVHLLEEVEGSTHLWLVLQQPLPHSILLELVPHATI